MRLGFGGLLFGPLAAYWLYDVRVCREEPELRVACPSRGFWAVEMVSAHTFYPDTTLCRRLLRKAFRTCTSVSARIMLSIQTPWQ